METVDPSRLQTDRLQLRRPRAGDLEALFQIHGDPATNRFNPAGPQTSIRETGHMLDRWLDRWEADGFGYWVAALREEPERIIGCGGLSYKEIAGFTRANLYFRFRPSAWGRGYATELAGAALRLGFERLGLDHVAATVRPANAPSIRLLERLGMVRSGEVVDEKGPSWLYALQRADTSPASGQVGQAP